MNIQDENKFNISYEKERNEGVVRKPA